MQYEELHLLPPVGDWNWPRFCHLTSVLEEGGYVTLLAAAGSGGVPPEYWDTEPDP